MKYQNFSLTSRTLFSAMAGNTAASVVGFNNLVATLSEVHSFISHVEQTLNMCSHAQPSGVVFVNSTAEKKIHVDFGVSLERCEDEVPVFFMSQGGLFLKQEVADFLAIFGKVWPQTTLHAAKLKHYKEFAQSWHAPERQQVTGVECKV